MSRRAIIYARLSPTPRGEEAKGGNLDEQVQLSQAKCDAEGWTVVDVITEKDTSATSNKPRPGWLRAVAMVRDGEADAIVSRHYDRQYRKVSDLEDLVRLVEETGVLLVAAQADGLGLDLTTATGRGQARFMAVGAQMETEIKAERQKLGHGRRVKEGRPFWGSRPFGFEKDGSHRASEAGPLRAAYAELLAGHTLYGITKRWNEAGLLTPKGNPWRSSNLRSVILHPRNAGIHTYTPRPRGTFHKPEPSGSDATWEPIVEPEIFEAVATLLGDPIRRKGGDGRRKGLLTNLAKCGKCDGAMGQTWNRNQRTDGSRLRKYQCRECHGTSLDADFLDDYVINRIVLNAPAIVAAKLGDEASEGLGADEVNALRAEQVRLGTKKDEYVEDYNDDLIDRDTMRKGIASANARIAEISEALAENASTRVSAKRWQADIEAMFYRLDQMDDPATHDELRGIIQDSTQWVKVLPRPKGKRFSGPEDVDVKLVTDS